MDRLADLWRDMYRGQGDQGMLVTLRDDAVEIWKRQLASRLDSPVSVILVADRAGEVVGFLAAQAKRLPPQYEGKAKVGFISEAFVLPSARRGNLGRRLVDAAFAWFRKADCGSVELHVLVRNEVGRKFWEEVGFVPELLQMRHLLS